MKLKRKEIITLIFIVLFTIAISFLIFANSYESEIIGSESIGHVTKDNYSYYGNAKIKIAIVSGMHPREKLSSDVLPNIARNYALLNNVEVVNYKVDVIKNAEDFYQSRINGEALVKRIVVPDINKSNYDLVIIGHDHEEGYGDGFYIATPSMDEKSVNLAEIVNSDLSDFKYYKRNINNSIESNSIITVDNPIVSTGTGLFVYEIPEWLGYDEAYFESYKLLETSVKSIKSRLN